MNITTGDTSYFRGLRDAGVDGAQEVLDLLEKYGEIRLEEVF